MLPEHLKLLEEIISGKKDLFHKGSEPFPVEGEWLLENGYIEEIEPDTNRFVSVGTDNGVGFLVDTKNQRILFLEAALREVNRCIVEDSKPIANFLNNNKNQPGHHEAVDAWKWSVYGTAIRAQIALGSDKIKEN